MKKQVKIKVVFLIISFCSIAFAKIQPDTKDYCIYMQHESTMNAGQGYCAYNFLFNSCYGNELRDIKINIAAKTQMEHENIHAEIYMDSIGASGAEQYKKSQVEMPCDISSIRITSGQAKINGDTIDLVSTKILQIDDKFEPLEIHIGDK